MSPDVLAQWRTLLRREATDLNLRDDSDRSWFAEHIRQGTARFPIPVLAMVATGLGGTVTLPNRRGHVVRALVAAFIAAELGQQVAA